MKPSSFIHEAPGTLPEALTILGERAEDAQVLAGGQSLVPMMAFRIAQPVLLVDINRIAALDYCQQRDDALHVGALTRHAGFHRPAAEGPLGLLLSDVVRHIAHLPIRTRGTFCGSLANADPASEWCLAAVALDAIIVVESATARREIPASEFFHGLLVTAMEPGEMIVEAQLPLLPSDARFGFCEFSRRAGDYALAMALVVIRLAEGRVVEARIALGSVEDRPRRIHEAEQILLQQTPSEKLILEAAATAAGQIDPLEDQQADAAFRRDLARVMIERAFKQALS